MTRIAQQGHLYRWGVVDVIALETGNVVAVREIDADEPLGIGARSTALASWLTPLPMKYFHGQVPRQQEGAST